MNPSPSSQSVSSMKPSTAASTASGKKRTIIVARNVPDATASSTTPPPTGGVTSSSSRSRLQQHQQQQRLTRDSNAGRLSSYAALGGEADVALYERFLAETKSTSGSGSDAGVLGAPSGGGGMSPQHLKASAKRRTMSQLPIHTSDESSSAPAAPPPPSIEDAADANQRRDAIIQRRKWLKSLPIHERTAYERQQNVLTKWKKINRQWEDFKARTSKKLGKSQTQLVMSRASEYREQMEMYDALQRAMPLSEKVGADIWLVSLRNDGTRYVPVGNIFSGLFCPIRESTMLQPRVRRPLDYVGGDIGGGDDTTAESMAMAKPPLSTLEKRAMDALARKKRRLKKQLDALFPHEVEPSQSGQLKVTTMDLFEWAAGSSSSAGSVDGSGDGDEQLSSLTRYGSSSRSLLLPLHEDDQENQADVLNSQRSSGRMMTRRTPRRGGPNLGVFVDGDSGSPESEDPAANHHQKEQLELSFFTQVETPQEKSVWLENYGTTMLQFQWRRKEIAHDELVAHLTHHEQSPLTAPERATWASISQRYGVLLPGDCVEIVFTYQSQRAGVWLEQWVLDVDPPLPRLASMRHEAACVKLQCTAVDNFVASTQRATQRTVATKARTTFMAEQILKQDIIHKVDPQDAVQYLELDDKARQFYDSHRRGCEFENVQYSPQFMDQCRALYAAAVDVVSAAVVAPAVVVEGQASQDESKTPRGSGEDPSNGALTCDESAATPLFPPEWDNTLVTLKAVATSGDALLLTEYTALRSHQQAGKASAQEEEEEDEEDDEEDFMDKLLGTKARLKEEAQAALCTLEPHFGDDFQRICLAANVTPYSSQFLEATLAEKLANMASETPVVLEIANMSATEEGEDASRAAAYELLRPLLARALDESLVLDRQWEKSFEMAKQQFHSVSLAEKKTFDHLPELVGRCMPFPDGNHPLVVFLQVDLDISNWFTLTGDAAVTPTPDDPAASPPPALAWTLSPQLLDHDTYVPPKIQAAAASIQQVLEKLQQQQQPVVLVLLSELTTPPMTKAMKKKELAAAKVQANGSRDVSAPLLTRVEVEAVRQASAQKRDALLTLRGVERVLQRALYDGPQIEFLGSLRDLDAQTSPPPTTTTDDHEAAPAQAAEPPRIFVMDHLAILARQALKKEPTHHEDAGVATPSAASQPLPTQQAAESKGKQPTAPAAADKKKPGATTAAASAAAAAATVKAPTPREPATAAGSEGDSPVVPAGLSVEMFAAQSLGQRLGNRGNLLIVDFFPTSWWESTFVYFASSPATPPPAALLEDPPSSPPSPQEPDTAGDAASITKHILVGPQLATTFSTWHTLFQSPAVDPDPRPPPMVAVVGGKGLAKKLRLLDGLLDRVETVYVVGELASTVYQVLYTKKLIQSLKKERKNVVPRFESQTLITAVEKLIDKAYRKQVQLLLPFDFVVGDTRLVDTADMTADGGGLNEDEEDEEEAEDEEEEEEEDDEDDQRKKKANKKATKPVVKKQQKPLEEPLEFDSWLCHKKQSSYDGEVATVELPTTSCWVKFTDVDQQLLATCCVVDGKESIIEPVETEEPVGVEQPALAVVAELDWLSRAFDIGPKSMDVLLTQLQQRTQCGGVLLFLNGTLGVVEYEEFGIATTQLVGFLEDSKDHMMKETPLLWTGKATTYWMQRLGSSSSSTTTPSLITSKRKKEAQLLAYVVETKPHAMLTAFDQI